MRAHDADQSPAFGNASLVYSVRKCSPDPYGVYADRQTGAVYSRRRLDADTDELMARRRAEWLLLVANASATDAHPALSRIAVELACTLTVQDAYGMERAAQADDASMAPTRPLDDTLAVTFQVRNINDNALHISVDSLGRDSTLEVLEGEATRGRILAQLAVRDKDDASELRCLFGSGLAFDGPFEFRTSPDAQDPFRTWCVLKVRDETFVKYDNTRHPMHIFELVVEDKGERTGITALLADLAQAGIRFCDLQTSQSSLEEIFVDLVKERA